MNRPLGQKTGDKQYPSKSESQGFKPRRMYSRSKSSKHSNSNQMYAIAAIALLIIALLGCFYANNGASASLL